MNDGNQPISAINQTGMIKPAMLGVAIVLCASSGFAETSSQPSPPKETPEPEAEAPSAEALEDIVFIPHDFGAPDVTDPGAVRGGGEAQVKPGLGNRLQRREPGGHAERISG